MTVAVVSMVQWSRWHLPTADGWRTLCGRELLAFKRMRMAQPPEEDTGGFGVCGLCLRIADSRARRKGKVGR